MKPRHYYVYLLTSVANSVIYTGVTNDLMRRIYEHREHKTESFTGKYNVYKLVYYEIYDDVMEALKREKQIKGGSRSAKIALISISNPEFRDLYQDLL